MASLAETSMSKSPNLGENSLEVWNLIHANRDSLTRLKRLSLRKGTWFFVLEWKHRRLIDLVIKTVDRIRSPLLLRVLAPHVRRLLTATGGDARKGALALMGSAAYETMRSVAQNIVQVARKWGNRSSHKWLNEGFIKYLMVMNLPQNRNSMAFI